jgi:glycine dehydrogenase subunit 1
MATIFLSCLGKRGLKELALMNLSKAEYAKKVASQIRGCKLVFSSPTFNEFILRIQGEPERVSEGLKGKKILGGFPLGRFYPEMNHHLLVTVTEMKTREEIDCWAEALEKALK